MAPGSPIGLVGAHALVSLERREIGKCRAWTIEFPACHGTVENDNRRARERE